MRRARPLVGNPQQRDAALERWKLDWHGECALAIGTTQQLLQPSPPGEPATTGTQREKPQRAVKLAQPPPSELPAGTLVVYTDGSGPDDSNRTRNRTGKAGWGFVVTAGDVNGTDDQYAREMHSDCGEVITERSAQRYIGAEAATNNTGELTAIVRALEYILAQQSSCPVLLRYDSLYAAGVASGATRARAHRALVRRANRVWREVHAQRNGRVWTSHVRGHSNNKWNDRADQLARQGKGGAPVRRRRRGVG